MRRGTPIVRWTLRGLAAIAVLAGLYVGALAFPRPLFAHSARFDGFTVYADRPLTEEAGRMVDEARRRVAAMERARSGGPHRVFLCADPRLYSVFTFLTRRSSNSLGIGLWALNTIYVNETKVQRMVAAGGRPRHSRFEGSAAEVIAHEIAHFNAIETLGLRPAVRLPLWKQEGYAEYQANLAATRDDPGYDFAARVALLLDDGFWGPGNTVARRYYGWQLLVEFLGDIEGMGLPEIADDAVTESEARSRMLAWYEARRAMP